MAGRELEILNLELNEQRQLVEELSLVQKVLSTLCHVSLYQISIYEAIRNKAGIIIDFNVQKVNINDELIKIEADNTTRALNINEKVIDQFSQSPKPDSSEYEFSDEDEDGKKRWFVTKLAVIKRTDDGSAQQLIAITQDITQKKAAELTSLEEQHIINSVTDASPDILFVMNLPSLAMIYTNKAVNDIFHYTPRQIAEMGSGFMNTHTHPEDRDKIIDYFESVSKQKDFPLKELHYKMKDAFGEWHAIRCRQSIFRTDKNGLPVQLIGVKQDITEFKRVQEKRMRTKIKRQQDISRAIVQTQEEERKRIAEVLHNSLGQVLYGIKLKLNFLDIVQNDPAKDNEEIKADISDLIDNAIKETRTISFELMPATLEDFGLEIAIKDILRKKLDRSPIKFRVFISGLKNRLPSGIEIAIFRIVQELINNLIKHSEATKAEVDVNRGADYIIIKVSDNGKGFSPEEVNSAGKGFGLRSIINRVKFLSGKITFHCAANKGAVIIVDIPL
ncbi:PAS domain-containing protein [Flavihumibacter sp. R14]|nr:PAS domain-containing protein [Flavihumibacter soli]